MKTDLSYFIRKCFLTSLVAVFTVSAGGMAFAEDVIELPNANFQEGSGQEVLEWRMVNPSRYPGELQIISEGGHDDKAALKIILGPEVSVEERYCVWVRNSGSVPVTNGEKVAFRLFLKAETQCEVFACLFQETAEGQWAGTVIGKVRDVSQDWQEFNGVLTVKGADPSTKEEAAVGKVSFGLIVYGDSQGPSPVVYLDDVSIQRE